MSQLWSTWMRFVGHCGIRGESGKEPARMELLPQGWHLWITRAVLNFSIHMVVPEPGHETLQGCPTCFHPLCHARILPIPKQSHLPSSGRSRHDLNVKSGCQGQLWPPELSKTRPQAMAAPSVGLSLCQPLSLRNLIPVDSTG